MKRLVLLLSCCILFAAALLGASQATRRSDAALSRTLRWQTGALPATGEVVGRVHVLDGDSIAVAGLPIRVWGIDAPEWRQRCRSDDGQLYRCGRVSFRALARRLQFASVRCVPRTYDAFGRIVATCYEGQEDVARWMVARGLALDWPRYSGGTYADAEAEARRAARGLWQGEFARPWDWRHRRAAVTSPP
jgi:endonuclease YncB( thermonuclease family)